MTDLAKSDELFFQRAGMDRERITGIVKDALTGADDGDAHGSFISAKIFTERR